MFVNGYQCLFLLQFEAQYTERLVHVLLLSKDEYNEKNVNEFSVDKLKVRRYPGRFELVSKHLKKFQHISTHYKRIKGA